MKTICFLLILFASGAVLGLMGAADATGEKAPELRGVLADGTGRHFGLLIPGTEQTAWVTVGQTLGGWKLKEYRATDETLILTKDGREEVLHLAESTVGEYHKATAADAEALLKVAGLDRRFAELFGRGLDGLARQWLAKNGIASPSSEQMMAVKKLLSDQVRVLAGQFQAGMAGVLSEVYTKEDLKAQNDFYGTAIGQLTLDKMFGVGGQSGQPEPDELKAFYATPAGQSVHLKQPQLQVKMGLMMPPLVRPMIESMQKSVADFARQQVVAQAPAKPAP